MMLENPEIYYFGFLICLFLLGFFYLFYSMSQSCEQCKTLDMYDSGLPVPVTKEIETSLETEKFPLDLRTIEENKESSDTDIDGFNTTTFEILGTVDELSKKYIKFAVVEEKLFAKSMNIKLQAENLLILRDFLEWHEVPYYLDCGTLLGAVREKNLIRGDTDADITCSKEGVETIRSNLHKLEEKGFISFRNANTFCRMSLLRNGEYIDIYTFDEKIPFPLIPYPFLGTYFFVPEHYREFLEELYGTDWMTPSDSKGTGNWDIGMPLYKKKYGVIHS